MYIQRETPKKNNKMSVLNSYVCKENTMRHDFGFIDRQYLGSYNNTQQCLDRSKQQVMIQRYPIKSESNDDYIDSDFPLLRLTKMKGYGEYKIKETDKIVYFEKYYWNDQEMKERADMREYIGKERPGITDLGGKSYYYYMNKSNGFIAVDYAEKIYQNFKYQGLDNGKLQSVQTDIDHKVPIDPIVLDSNDKGYTLVDGRHRITASIKRGFKWIPMKIRERAGKFEEYKMDWLNKTQHQQQSNQQVPQQLYNNYLQNQQN